MAKSERKFSKLFIVTKDAKGHLHHYMSADAVMHMDIILHYDINLDKEEIVEKGFILPDHRVVINFDIRKKKSGLSNEE